ncbi:hypothetical protein J0H58_10330 [bacterium]|nr:hypothetical protein [bacterium]
MFRTAVLASVVAVWAAADLPAQPFPGRFPSPIPHPQTGIEGVWYFRGDPFQPCSVQTQWTPVGPQLVFVNEMGSPAAARLSRDGRRVEIPEWNLAGRVYPDRIVWPNGDFWAR